jgi:polar amino acid transport system substrate-binding protein
MKRIRTAIVAGVMVVSVALVLACLWTDARADERHPNLDNTLREVKARGKIVVGVPSDEPPFGFIDEKGKLEGLAVDLGKALSKEILGDAHKVEFVAVSDVTMVDLLKTGRIDMILAPLCKTAEGKEEMDFTVPYLVCGDLVLVERDSNIRRYKGLKDRTIAVVDNSAASASFAELFPSTKKVQFRDNREALEALKKHQVEAFLALDAFVFYAEQMDRNLKIVELRPLLPSPVRIGVRKNDLEWRDSVDIALLKMIAAGEYHGILDKWFGSIRGAFLELALREEMDKKP